MRYESNADYFAYCVMGHNYFFVRKKMRVVWF